MPQFTLNAEHSITISNDNRALGNGSSRFSVRNQYVARVLNGVNLATLLFDLLTPYEDAIDSRTRQFRFGIEFLASRLLNATQWCFK